MKKILLILILLFVTVLQSNGQVAYEISASDGTNVYAYNRFVGDIGKKEQGYNTGIHITKYHNYFGYNPKRKLSYCAMAICWSYGKKTPFRKSANANKVFTNCRSIGTQVKFIPEKYNLIVWRKGNTASGHIGMIDSVGRKMNVWTLEANTGPPNKNQGNGDGNYRKKRNLHHIISRMRVRGIIKIEETKN